MYIVAPMPAFLTAPSVIIHSLSFARGSVIVRCEDSAFCAAANADCRLSDQTTLSFDCKPATVSSNGARCDAHLGKTLANTLYEPKNERIAFTVVGALQVASVASRWGLALRVPSSHVQPNIVVAFGPMMVFVADRQRLFSWSADSTVG